MQSKTDTGIKNIVHNPYIFFLLEIYLYTCKITNACSNTDIIQSLELLGEQTLLNTTRLPKTPSVT